MNILLQRAYSFIAPATALRPTSKKAPKVTNMELFFDLVYVFTIIQLSHYLIENPTWAGALQALTLFAAVWWSWNYTAWATNWLNPDSTRGRIAIAVWMLFGIGMAVAIPHAYETTALLFIAAYLLMGVSRAGYMALLFRGKVMGRNYLQLGAWTILAGIFWILGAVDSPERRVLWWIAAVVVDYIAPLVGFWLPKIKSTPMESWPLSSEHLAERNQQVFIIALGESVILLGATLAATTLSLPVATAAIIGFVSLLSLWWIYFVHTSAQGAHAFEKSHTSHHTRMARSGFAYANGIMVSGAIVGAVAIEQVIAHPLGHTTPYLACIVAAGPIIFLTGTILFNHTIHSSPSQRSAVAVIAIAALCLLGLILAIPPIALAGLVAFVLAVASKTGQSTQTTSFPISK